MRRCRSSGGSGLCLGPAGRPGGCTDDREADVWKVEAMSSSPRSTCVFQPMETNRAKPNQTPCDVAISRPMPARTLDGPVDGRANVIWRAVQVAYLTELQITSSRSDAQI